MPKNVLIFFDGTSNKFGDNLTNVAKIHSIVDRSQQDAFYCPGVGSIADKMEYSRLSKYIKKYLGLGLGFGLQEKIIAGYTYLMEHYDKDDKIFIFGFSRGSYTAKVLAGLIHTCGLLEKGNEYNIQYAYDLYTRRKFRPDLLAKFKSRYARHTPTIHFMGLWDSVSSVGNLIRMRNLPYTTNVANVSTIRHALALDEKRALFKQNSTRSQTDCKEVWFAGVHGDVGGGNAEMESGLAKVPLKWMIDEAVKRGLIINQSKYDRYVISDNVNGYAPVNPLGKAHKNNFWTWGILELLPRYKIVSYDPEEVMWYWPLFGRRKIQAGALFHESVQQRMDDPKIKYNPSNLPKDAKVYKNE